MRATPFLVAAGLLLALPTVAADDGTLLKSKHLTAFGPDPGEMEGNLILFSLSDAAKQGSSIPVPPFSVNAESILLSRDWVDMSLWANALKQGVPLGLTSSNDTEHAAVYLEETSNRPGYNLDLYPTRDRPAPKVTLTRGCFQVDASQRDTIERESHLSSSRASITADVSRALNTTTCRGDDGSSPPGGTRTAGTRIVVEGFFMLHLWEVDVLMTDTTGSELVPSGHIATAGTEDTPVGGGRSQEVYITVRNGILEVPVTSEGVLYTSSLEGDLDGTVSLEKARGRLEAGESSVFVDSETVELRGGPIHVLLQGQGKESFDARVRAGWKEATVGSVRLQPAAAVQEAPGSAGLALVATLAALAWSRRRPPARAL